MNYTQIKQKVFFNIPKPLLAILIIACAVRLIVVFVRGNFSTDFYWEYGEIAKNILTGHGYSLYYISNNELSLHFNSSITPFHSALMAPGYVGFLLPFIMIGNVLLSNVFIICIQLIFSLLTIVLIYKFTVKYFSERAALLSGVIAGILPDFAYSVISFTPTVFYHCAVIAMLFLLYSIIKKSTYTKIIQLSVVFVFLSYLRWEFFLFVILFLLLQIFLHRWKDTGIVLLVTISLLSPWTIRNYHVFGTFVPFSTGFGLNFYRGNNPDEIGTWGDEDIKREALALPQDRTFEVRLDHLYRQQAFNFIQSHPWQALSNIPTKLFHLWIFSPLQERSNNYLFQLFSGGFFIFSIIGLLVTFSWHRHKYLYLFLVYSTVIALLFFTLPRHQTMMKIVLIPLAGAGLEFLWNLFRGKKKDIETKYNNQQSA
ncbi:MAG: glycosyltransferase family 39 protein [Bacteroidota bacterium]|jgi:hypothetical protein